MAAASKRFICDLNNLSRPDGSAIFCQGNSCVQAAVYGPAEVRLQKEIVDKAYVDVVYKPKIGLPGCAEKLSENLIKNTCESAILAALHPRTSVTVILQEQENRGSLMACSINSACMALMDSSIEMKCLVGAVCCAIVNDEVIVYPTEKQEKDAEGIITMVLDSQNRGIIAAISFGKMTDSQLKACISESKKVADQLFRFYRESVERRHCKLI